MTGSIMPPGPLSYVGEVSTPFITRTFNPDTSNNQFPVPTIWINTGSSEAFILVSKAGGVAEWLDLGSEHGVLDTITTPDTVIITPTAGNINFTQSGPINITGNAGTSTIHFAVEDPIMVNHGGTGSTSFNTYGPVVAGPTTTAPLTSVSPTSTVGVPLVSEGTSANPAFGTAVVQGGGTGNTALAAYSVLTGGTTNTAPIQTVSGVGTTGQILTSNGAGALPTWQTHPAGALQVNIQTFTTSGTYTPTTGMQYCVVECVGAGGGGGGAATGVSNGVGASGAGGGAGAYARWVFDAATIGVSQPVGIGTGGAGGANTGGVGGNGGGTALGTGGGTLIIAYGGNGGIGSLSNANNAHQGGIGGTGSPIGSTFLSPGQAGGGSFNYAITTGSGDNVIFSGSGANSYFGPGGDGWSITLNSQGAGNNGFNGGGGGGAYTLSTGTGQLGGTGGNGLMIITEYL